MVRIVTDDFHQLKDYINNYSLSPISNNSNYINQLSSLHKRYFALLTFIAEIENDNFNSTCSVYGLDSTLKEKFANYIKEAISDLGNALFNWLNGAYKGSRILIRSSIENIIRGLSILEDASVSEITVSYDLFEASSDLIIFSSENALKALRTLKGNYSELCKDVHTAGTINMEHLSALIYFPGYNEEKASTTATIYRKVAQDCLVLLSICFRVFIFKMHPNNIDTILLNLPKVIRTEIHNP